MQQFLYVSTARDLSPRQVDAIVMDAAERNRDRGITGFLVYNGSNFLQVIEGELTDLEALMASISRDDRHHGIVTLEKQRIAARAFPDWGMTAIDPAEDGIAKRFAVGAEMHGGVHPRIRDIILNFAKFN